MTAIRPPTLLTAEEFVRRPERADGWREELVRGAIVVTPPPGFPHGFFQLNIGSLLRNWARVNGLGRVTVESGLQTESDPDSVRGPDVAYWSAERLPLDVVPEVYPDVAADLCVEVLSPGDQTGAKVAEYLAAGVRAVWVVDAEGRTVTVYRGPGAGHPLDATATLTDEEVLPGFSCLVGEFFE